MKTLNYFIWMAALLLILLSTACKKDDLIIKPELSNSINLPLPLIDEASFSARDLIERIDSTSFLYIDEDSLINFRITESFNEEWNDLVELDEFTISKGYDLNPVKKSVKLDTTFIDSIKVNFIEFQSFDSITIQEADLDLSITMPAGFDGSYTISIPKLKNAGNELVQYSSNSFGTTETYTEVLDGGRLGFENNDNGSYMLIETRVDVTINGDFDANNSSFTFDISLTDLKPDFIFGYFGTMDVISEDQEFEFDFFETLDIGADVNFKDMELVLGINNYFGLPLGVRFDSLVFTKEGVDPVYVYPPDIVVNSAMYDTLINEVNPVYDSILINSSTSNLMNGINMGPEKIYIAVVGSINPDSVEQQNFISANNVLEGDVTATVPLWFNTSQYSRTDTFNVSYDSTQIELFEQIDLEFSFVNSFPFDISGQIFMVNEKGDSIGTLLANKIDLMKAPDIDPVTGVSLNAAQSNQVISLTSARMLELMGKGGKTLVLQSYVSAGYPDPDGNPANGDDGLYVKLLTTNSIKISFALNGKSSGEL